ncbi:TRAP transporter large permease subunit [Chloroflexota bacterium]
MEWQLALLVIIGGSLLLMLTGMPVAFCFLLIGVIGSFVFFGGEIGLHLMVSSLRASLTLFSLLPVVLFILMGEVMFHSGIAPRLIDALDKWIGHLPGRLSLEAIAGGTVFSTLTGTSIASTAMLGELLVPEMEKRGYKKSMSLGPILGSGGLAMMIPPSSLAVLAGALATVSIGRTLIGIVIPGLLMATLYAIYTIVRCRLQPQLAPPYDLPPVSLEEKLLTFTKYILPLVGIVFMVTGVIILGIATPSEAAATGCVGVFILVACYGKLTWQTIKKSMVGTVTVAVMILTVISASRVFTHILAYSGGARGMIDYTLGLDLEPIFVILAMQFIVLIMGMFMGVVSIMMIVLPIFMPIVTVMGFDPVWFLVIFLLNIEMGTTSPPVGMSLYVMKGVAPPDTTMGDVYRAALPYLGCDLIIMVLLITFPSLVLWLPGLMR